MRGDLPKGLLDATDVVLAPVALGHILLTNRDAGPCDAHVGNAVRVILLELKGLLGEMASWPLVQAPCLDNLCWCELDELSRDVAIEQLELATLLGTFEFLGRGTSKGSEALRIGKGLVQLVGRGLELLRLNKGGGVHDTTLVVLGGSGRAGVGSLGTSLDMLLGSGEATGRVGARLMLDILTVLSDESRRELLELLNQLWLELGPDEVPYGLLLSRLRVDGKVLDLETDKPPATFTTTTTRHALTTMRSSSWVTSGTVNEPETSSTPGALP